MKILRKLLNAFTKTLFSPHPTFNTPYSFYLIQPAFYSQTKHPLENSVHPLSLDTRFHPSDTHVHCPQDYLLKFLFTVELKSDELSPSNS